MMSMTACAYHSRPFHLVILLGALALLLSGCNLPWQANQSDKAKDQTMKMGWSTGGGRDITTLDPAQCADASCLRLISLVYDGLVTTDRNEHIEPWAARSWTISPDGLTYTFRLQPNQRFSDGVPVKPSDYAWSMDRSANPCLGSQLSYYLAAIKDASAFSGEPCLDGQIQGSITTLVGDSIVPNDSANTLTITLAQPAGHFLAALTYPTSFAVEKSVVTGAYLGRDDTWLDNLAKGATGQGGSGMFYVSAWDHQGVLIFKQNPHWWGKKPNFTTVDFKLFASTDTEYGVFHSDQTLAYADTIPMDQIAAAKNHPDYHEQAWLALKVLLLNWKIAPFDDINARKAFCLAINRDQINQQVYQGGNMPTWHLVPQGMPGYNDHLHGLDNTPTSGDMALARGYWQQYLTAHPHWKMPAQFTVAGSLSSASSLMTLNRLQADFSQMLGQNITLKPPWQGGILQQYPDPYSTSPLSLFGWSDDYPDPEDFLTLLYTSDSPYNTQSASIPAADALMKQADALPDMAQRLPLYNVAEQLLIDNVAACPLFQYVNYYALRPWVKGGFVEDARGVFPNDAWVSGYIAKH
jgi:peptide/nickel transport system substrate-binding protein/oligopeptide transport system substrate-binding protein